MIDRILHRPPHASNPSEIRVAERLKGLADSPHAWTVSFHGCDELTVAEGKFDGFVSFVGSGVERIGNLIITQPNQGGEWACFTDLLINLSRNSEVQLRQSEKFSGLEESLKRELVNRAARRSLKETPDLEI